MTELTEMTEDEFNAIVSKHFKPTPLWRRAYWRIRDAMPWSPTPEARWERAMKRLQAELEGK